MSKQHRALEKCSRWSSSHSNAACSDLQPVYGAYPAADQHARTNVGREKHGGTRVNTKCINNTKKKNQNLRQKHKIVYETHRYDYATCNSTGPARTAGVDGWGEDEIKKKKLNTAHVQ